MRRPTAAWRTGLFLVCVPGVVAGAMPGWIVSAASERGWQGSGLTAVLGWSCVGLGTIVLLDSFVRFVREGRGTPAPSAPTEELVVRGAYRWVRNPMYVAVLLVIFGQTLAFAEPLVLAYGVVVAIAVTSFVHWYEEPTLARRYGAQYAAYLAAVPRWWPRRPRRSAALLFQPSRVRTVARS